MPDVIAIPSLNRGPGYLFRAPMGTALPTNTVGGSVFTDVWQDTTGWVRLGATEEGTEVTYEVETEDVTAAEFLDPLAVAETGRTVNVNFGLISFDKSTLLASYNAGSSAVATSGSGATLLTTITPPDIGDFTNCIIGFQSEDKTYRSIYFNCFNQPSGARVFKKGGDKTVVPFSYRCLADPTLGVPFKEYLAGAARGA